MDISFVGLRGHAQRLRKIVEKLPNINIKNIYYHKKIHNENLKGLTNNIEDLLKSDAIFIASPTHLHLEHIIKFINYKGYIFLEKPAVNTLKDIVRLNNLPDDFKRKIFINFNFEFSSLAEILSAQMTSVGLGEILWLDIHTSHGAAFRKSWENAWRLNGENKLGPVETTGIHFLQYAASRFGGISNIDIKTRSVVGRNNSVDTGFAIIEFNSGTWVRVRNSYATPYLIRFEMMGTNGYLIYDGSVCKIFSPRETFDYAGLFSTPKVVDSQKIIYADMWEDSLHKSVSFFIENVSRNNFFSIEKFNLNVNIMKYLISA